MLVPVITSDLVASLGKLPEPIRSSDDFEALKKLGVAGAVYLAIGNQGKDDASIKSLKPILNAVPCCVGPFGPGDDTHAANFLDAGCAHVVFDVDVSITDDQTAGESEGAGSRPSVTNIAETVASLSSGRVLLRLKGAPVPSNGTIPAELSAAIMALKQYCSGIIVEVESAAIPGEAIKQLRALSSAHVRLLAQAASGAVPLKTAEVARLHRHEVSALAPAVLSMSDDEVSTAEAAGKLDIGACLVACIRSDRPDGLFTTVVQDESGHTLGLVYSSKESVLEAIRVGRGVYYSRSRGGLWRKGDTSGNFQVLRHLRLDCDSDALLFSVQQMGTVPAFCHLNTRSCWGEDGGLAALERTLVSRKTDAPAGSYTKRLFDDHQLLKNKLLEEAQELGEATEPDHVAAEAADLLYFALVACVKAGISIADVESHLDRRALKIRRRPGDAKPARIAAAKAHFDELHSKAAGSSSPAAPAQTEEKKSA